MLVPRGCCSTLMLLFHPAPAGAQSRCQSLLPVLPGELRCCHARLVAPKSRQGLAGDALSATSVSAAFCCSDLASTPKNGEKKKRPFPGVPLHQRMGSQILRETGKTLQEPKKPENPKSRGFLQEHNLLWPQPSSHHLLGGPQLWGRAEVGTPSVPRKPSWGHPINAGAPQNHPGCFSCRLSSKEKGKQGWAGQYSPQRRELLSSGTEPRCAVGINTSEPVEPQRRILSKQRP